MMSFIDVPILKKMIFLDVSIKEKKTWMFLFKIMMFIDLF